MTVLSEQDIFQDLLASVAKLLVAKNLKLALLDFMYIRFQRVRQYAWCIIIIYLNSQKSKYRNS